MVLRVNIISSEDKAFNESLYVASAVLERFRSFNAEGIDSAQWVCVVAEVKVSLRVKNCLRSLSCRGVVEIHYVNV